MTSTPCRYHFGSGCAFGDDCRYSHAHGTKEQCRYYLQGNCAFGDSCRYSHDSADGRQPTSGDVDEEYEPASEAPEDDDDLHFYMQQLVLEHGLKQEHSEATKHHEPEASSLSSEELADRPICQSYAAWSTCAQGTSCRHVHGLFCEHCGRNCLHPHNATDREDHVMDCQARSERMAAAQRSRQIDCGICLERVLEKTNAADRQFGLLECEHAFCLACIRGWRSHLSGGADLDSALRTCPVCRTPSWFVTPSRTWPGTSEEKAATREAYMGKLATIDCKHFAFGDGTCPFGASCFYRHASRDGVPQGPAVRWYTSADGERKSYQPVHLAGFLAESALVQG